MNPHLESALELYRSNDIDIQDLIGWHLQYGLVFSSPKAFALGFHSRSEEPNKAVAFEHSDTLHCTICCGDMLSGLSPFKDDYEYIAFRRDFKGSSRTRLLNMTEFYSKLK